MPSITVYGASDDLIEVEGDIREEFGCYRSENDWDENPLYLAVSDGTLLRVRYDNEGMWRFTPTSMGSARYEKHEATDADDDYTDKVTLALPDGEEFRWVLLGKEIARA